MNFSVACYSELESLILNLRDVVFHAITNFDYYLVLLSVIMSAYEAEWLICAEESKNSLGNIFEGV